MEHKEEELSDFIHVRLKSATFVFILLAQEVFILHGSMLIIADAAAFLPGRNAVVSTTSGLFVAASPTSYILLILTAAFTNHPSMCLAGCYGTSCVFWSTFLLIVDYEYPLHDECVVIYQIGTENHSLDPKILGA